MAVGNHTRETPMPSLRIGRRGQITIPSALRRELHLDEGDHVIVTVRAGELVLRPAGRPLFDLRGSVPVDGPQDFAAIRTQVTAHRARRLMSDTE